MRQPQSLGDRMKRNYEDITRYHLPRRTHTIIRVDGRAFHTLTKNYHKPFDHDFMRCMAYAAKTMCEQIQGARLAYLFSDEISVLLTDYDNLDTDAWFDGNLQKMVSVAASIATMAFNEVHARAQTATFDARVFTIPEAEEVVNYFIWRQQDCERNSLNMIAQSLYSHKELIGKGRQELHEMLYAKGHNWNNYLESEKRGEAVVPRWVIVDPPIFTKDRDFIRQTFCQQPIE